MKTIECSITLAVPCFLGDASQSGAWRTPPFKALLREWWRIAAALDNGHDHSRLREREGELFGKAWLDSGATRSKVRLALKRWHVGKPISFTDDPRVDHQEVGKVGSLLYLGYGPLKYVKGTGTVLKANAALQADDENTFSLAWPETEMAIPHTLQLIDWFGTVGGRSRNGWGSLALLPLPPGEGRGEGLVLEPLTADHPQLVAVLRDLSECLCLEWPHAIGQDAHGPLIWESKESFADWKAAMTFLARTKIGFRTDIVISAPTRKTKNPKIGGNGLAHNQPEKRHVLAYPVTHHAVYPWLNIGNKGCEKDERRLANQLRFKLFRDANQKLRARIYHTPHACPLPMNNLDQLAIWQRIHAWLDQRAGLTRLGGRP